jgi:hypothetical protein
VPIVYQAQCGKCSYASEIFPSEYGAVFLDDPFPRAANSPLAGAVLHDARGKAFAKQEDPRLVALAHPIEGHILAATGYTWTSLAWAGRYIRIRRVACLLCGTIFDVRRLACPPGVGSQIGCVTGVAAGITVGAWVGSFWIGLCVGYGFLAVYCALVGALGYWYTRLRFRERAGAIDGPRSCPNCDSIQFVPVAKAQKIPCPKCADRAMTVRIVGKS